MNDYIDIWTDGACKGNPGKGGWGAVLQYKQHRKELYGGEENTTNNRMEMQAVIEALQSLKKPHSKVRLHIDSQYVKNGITQWMPNWIARGWKTADKKPVKNQDLWLQLNALCQLHEIDWIWVKGHAGNPGNEKADELANLGVAQLTSST
ncbi:RNaseH ribonuclease [Pelistega indica]|uniref:Ribonuclease H n=1 Tax=Pelistega indica TaxID=1414851 RepID=V8G853_9BURK|nr:MULTISPECIES: ribonuclease HI [Pelistega]ETD72133.1 RNaseH ribonuclease [Pelistega indica]